MFSLSFNEFVSLVFLLTWSKICLNCISVWQERVKGIQKDPFQKLIHQITIFSFDLTNSDVYLWYKSNSNLILNSASPGSTGTNPISNVGLPAKFDVFNTC